jgi:metal-responsive CopG/Arc/MetJ family transcriptional regulator
MVKKYINISIPDELVTEMDLVVKNSSLGYRGRADLAKEAIRHFLKDLINFEETRKSNIKFLEKSEGTEQNF